MKVRVARANNDGWLPKPRGHLTEDACRAIALYNQLHGSRPVEGRAWHRASWELTGLLKILNKQELAEYYTWVGRILRGDTE